MLVEWCIRWTVSSTSLNIDLSVGIRKERKRKKKIVCSRSAETLPQGAGDGAISCRSMNNIGVKPPSPVARTSGTIARRTVNRII